MQWLIASAVAGIASGVVLADSVRADVDPTLWPWLACTAVVAAGGVVVGRAAPWPWIWATFAFLGFGAHLASAPPSLPWDDGGELAVVATVVEGARPTAKGWVSTVETSRCNGKEAEHRLLLRGDGTPPPVGARLRASGVFRAWRTPDANYLFDGPRYGAIHGTRGSLLAREVTVADGGSGAMDRWRLSREATARQALGDDNAAMVLAIVTGSRGLASRDRRAPINDAGLGHLLAISGLHLVTVGGLFVWLLGLAARLFPRLAQTGPGAAIRWLVPLAAVVGYASVCGWPVSAQRAAAMFVVWRLAALLRRPAAAAPTIAAAVAVTLAVQGTEAIFDPGLQLSVAAVVGIVLAMRGLSDPRWSVRLVRVPMVVTLACTAATAPLTMLHFGRLPLLGGLLNLLCVPLVQFIALPVGLAGFVLPAPLGTPLLWVSAYTLHTVEWLARHCPAPGMVAGIGDPTWLALGLVAAGGLALASRPRSALCALFAASLLASSAGGASARFLPVGQGDAILVTNSDGDAVLVDAGGDASGDVGTGVVLPALARAGARLRVVVLSHPDADHIAGLASVVRAARPEQVWIADAHAAAAQARPLLAAARDVGALVRPPPARASLGDLALRRLPGVTSGSDNDQSVVYEADVAGLRVLLTGDIEEAGERAAARTARPAHVLKVAHHGSRTSSTAPLLRASKPTVGVISSGLENRFGHPHKAALHRLRRHAIPSWNTADCGHMEVRAQAGRLVLRGARPCAGHRRPVGVKGAADRGQHAVP